MQILRSDSNAVVYLGTSGVLARLFRAAESTPEAGRLQWVLPERVEFTPYAKGRNYIKFHKLQVRNNYEL